MLGIANPGALRETVEKLSRGGGLEAEELVGLLCEDSREARFRTSAALAGAYLRSGRLEPAAELAERAWLLSDFSGEFLPDYLRIQTECGNLERVREAYKRMGMRHAAAGNVVDALRYFNLHHYAYQRAGQGDRYDYDFEILAAVESLAGPYRASGPRPGEKAFAGKARLAYLVFGATHSESVLVKMLCYFARFHDRSRYDVRFFVPDRGMGRLRGGHDSVLSANVERLRLSGARVELPEASEELDSLLETAAKIAEFRPQLLVTTAVLADYSHYFLASTEPAPVRVGLVYGPPEQYVAPNLDWVITATKHPLIDSPCDATLVPFEVDLPKPESITAASRADLDVPADATLVIVVGRPEKFIDRSFWSALSAVLSEHHGAFLLVVGLGEEPEFLNEVMTPETRSRLRILGYRKDYLRILAMADIVLDTFPSGGGVVLLDAVGLGIPTVTFRNDYGRKFDQTRWSPGEEFLHVAELIIPRGDFEAFKSAVGRLIAEPEHRRRMGEACQASARRFSGQPERMVRRHEHVYDQVLGKFRHGELRRSPAALIPASALTDLGRPTRSLVRRGLERVRRTGAKVLRGLFSRA